MTYPSLGLERSSLFHKNTFLFLRQFRFRLCSSLETNENENENEVLRREEAFSAPHLFRVSRGKCTSYE